jgi:hypothetical protein
MLLCELNRESKYEKQACERHVKSKYEKLTGSTVFPIHVSSP